MSYTIEWIHDNYTVTELQTFDDEGKIILSPVVELSKNEAGSFSFTMTARHAQNGALSLFTDFIAVSYQGYQVFFGRVMKYTKNFDKSITYECEGALAFLYDAYVYPTWTYSWASNALALVLGAHKRMLDGTWLPTNVSSVSSLDNMQKYARTFSYDPTEGDTFPSGVTLTSSGIEEGIACYDALTSLLSNAGGYVAIERVQETIDGNDVEVNKLTYYSSYWDRSEQTVRFGINLLDYVEEFSREDLITCVHGVAKVTVNDTESEVQQTDKYFGYANIINTYGLVVKTLECDEITTLAALQTRCLQYLQNQYDNLTITVTVADLSLAEDYEENPFHMYQLVHVISEPHNINTWMPVTAMTIDLDNPANTSLTLGETQRKGLIEKITNTKVTKAPTVEQEESSGSETVTYPTYKTTANLNLRNGPGTSYSKLVTIPKGTKITVTDSSGNWRKTTYSNKTGWCNVKYLKQI